MSPYDFGPEADLTNKQLAGELAKLSPLTAVEIEKLLPTKADKKRLKKLIEIVNSSASQNSKLASLVDNFSELGGVVTKLLTRYLRPI